MRSTNRFKKAIFATKQTTLAKNTIKNGGILILSKHYEGIRSSNFVCIVFRLWKIVW
jgi:hypothetical protein